MKFVLLVSLLLFSLGNNVTAEVGHDEKHTENEPHEHESESEDNPQVGPGKGITEASESDGFKLSIQAIKNFEVQMSKISNLQNIIVPKRSIITAGEEENIFRYRNGFFKRIDFTVNRKENDKIYISSKDLKIDDQIVINGTGFLRVAEIAAFGGAPEGHSH